MRSWIEKTAWPMTTPAPYSMFHICFTVIGVLIACLCAQRLKKNSKIWCDQVLFFCGLGLAASEIYKQYFLYYVGNGQSYDWWYFPFQLCSLPMYLCLLLPLIRSPRLHRVICTFMQDFNLLGGLMALIEPSGLMHPYWTMTIHGLVWHIVLIFIGLFIALNGQADRSIRGFLNTLPLFGICCLIASFINVATHTLGHAEMFYISPYYPTGQVVFRQVALQFGIMAGNVTYLLAICLGGFLCHIGLSRSWFFDLRG